MTVIMLKVIMLNVIAPLSGTGESVWRGSTSQGALGRERSAGNTLQGAQRRERLAGSA
jgi:hypothetical protein